MGEIITFYSYKGGTGRSMALANVAWILASRKKRVLMIDWDLEAPGLHRYFAPFLVDRDLSGTRGVIDFIREFAIRAATPAPDGKQKPDWYLPVADMLDYAVSIRWPHFSPGMLDFIPAGQQDTSYATRVNSFSWDAFYDRLGGGPFLDAAKKIILEQYDYILIDSRTGVSDTSGICTVQMPDTVVVCFTLNNQSIKGAYSVARSIAAQRTDAAGKLRVRILPVATRVDTFEKVKLDGRRAYAKTVFDEFLSQLPASYWKNVEVPYWSYYAYEECLATFGDEAGAPNSMLGAFEGLTSHLTNGDVRTLIPPPAETRPEILSAFAEIPSASSPGPPSPSLSPAGSAFAHDLYLSYHHLDEGYAGTLAALLEGRRLSGIADSRSAALDDNWAAALHGLLDGARAFAFCEGRFGISTWQKRELAFALEHQRRLASEGRHFPVIPILLPQANTPPDEARWLYLGAVDLRRRLEDGAALDAFARSLLSDERPVFPASANPYKGAAPFTERDAPLYFGRDTEVDSLAELVTKSQVLFVTGASGIGKSSLINAGLFPRLRRQAPPAVVWEAVRCRPGSTPFLSLVRELVPLWSTEVNDTKRTVEMSTLATQIANGTLSLHSVLQLALERPPRPSRLLIVVDQLEELFLNAPREHWQRFLQNLQIAAERTPTTVLLVVRPEWEDAIVEVVPRWQWLIQHAFQVPPMRPEALQEAIFMPARFAGRTDPWVQVEELATTAYNEPGALALISRQLYEAWASGEFAPHISSILAKALDTYLGQIPELERNMVLSAVSRLVRV